MRHFRFHLGTLVIVVLAFGVGFAGLREASVLWESGIFTATPGVLLTSILLAVHRKESRRAFWIGFALFGWIYLGLALLPPIESRLITTKALHYLNSKMPVDTAVVPTQVWGNVTGNQNEHTIPAPILGIVKKVNHQAMLSWLGGGGSGKTENFVRIGHSFMALLLAWFGGQLSRYFYTKNIGRETSAAVDLE